MTEPQEIKRIKDPRTTEDGKEVSFIIETIDGDEFAFKCMSHNLDKFVWPFVWLAQIASTKMSPEELEALAPKIDAVINPIPASQIGVGEGRHPTEVFLGLHLGTMSLWFSVETTELKKLEAVIGKLVPVGTVKKH